MRTAKKQSDTTGTGRNRVLAVVALLFAVPALLPGQYKLEFADKVRMVNCSPATTIPCFRVKANIVDADGAPAAIPLPNPELLAKSITINTDRQQITPFYASVGEQNVEKSSRVALIVIDTSGSMLQRMPSGQTRFEAAKAAASRFLDGFEQGLDQVAIVPFESHQVAPRIRAAQFATTVEQARQQIDALPEPQIPNNTALYSAIDVSLDVLLQKMASDTANAARSSEVMLIVLTDGRNDVQAGDDPGLLGDEGTEIVGGKVGASGVQVIAVGLGNSSSIDMPALERVSTRSYLVSDEESLSRAFSFARELLLNRLQVTFQSPEEDRASLGGQSLRVQMTLAGPAGNIESNQAVWSSPQMGLPLFEGDCEPAELKALLADPTLQTESSWWGVIRPVLVFLGIGALIMILWFWIPRLVWPEQYMGDVPVVASRGRWASQGDRPSGGARPGAAPAGFSAKAGGSGGAARRPGDATVVQPRAPSGRTRLGNRGRDDY